MLERWAVIVDVDPAPPEGPEFDAWCVLQGFTVLGSGRRAWCAEFGTYLRGAYGVATVAGERFLVWEDDLIDPAGVSKGESG